MVRFCEVYQDEIIAQKIDYTLKDIINGYRTNFGSVKSYPHGEKVAKYLNAYMKERKETFRKAFSEKKDALCTFEFSKDAKYTFEFEDIKNLY